MKSVETQVDVTHLIHSDMCLCVYMNYVQHNIHLLQPEMPFHRGISRTCELLQSALVNHESCGCHKRSIKLSLCQTKNESNKNTVVKDEKVRNHNLINFFKSLLFIHILKTDGNFINCYQFIKTTRFFTVFIPFIHSQRPHNIHSTHHE